MFYVMFQGYNFQSCMVIVSKTVDSLTGEFKDVVFLEFRESRLQQIEISLYLIE